MKKLLLVLLLSVIAFTAFSQNTYIGINKGVGHTWRSNMYTNYESKFFLFHTCGASLLQTIAPNLAIGADLNYSFEGGNQGFIQFETIPQSYDQRMRIQFLRLPIKAHWFFGNSSAVVRPSVYLGPSIGYLLQATTKEVVKHDGPTIYHNENITKKYNSRIDFGLQGGLGLNFRISDKTTVNTSANYYHGLLNTWGMDEKNRNISLNVGVLWTLGEN